MSTRKKPPTDTYVVGPEPDFGEDEPTRVDLAGDSGEVTPELQDHCVECGGIVFVDRADLQSSWPEDRCLRSWDGKRWHSCAKLRKSVTYW